jgi:aminoglycoside phosphotransferase (APT) family kinase protein
MDRTGLDSMNVEVSNDTVRSIIEYHLHDAPTKIVEDESTKTNHIFEVGMKGGEQYIVKISDIPYHLQLFMKEQWAVQKARDRGVPCPEILEVNNKVVDTPYLIMKKVEGIRGTDHPNRFEVIKQMGKVASMTNSVPTTGFGDTFDWSHNTLSKYLSWKQYLNEELIIWKRFEILEKFGMMDKDQLKRLKDNLQEIEKWEKEPGLNHGNLRIKNVIVDDDARVVALLDWKNANSNISPYWDLSIALHDLGIDEKQAFLDGYGIRGKDIEATAWAIKTFNIINYAPFVKIAGDKKDAEQLDKFKLRLSGSLDWYAL